MCANNRIGSGDVTQCLWAPEGALQLQNLSVAKPILKASHHRDICSGEPVDRLPVVTEKIIAAA